MPAYPTLGRFANGAKSTLQRLGAELRLHRYVPIIFDFPRPEQRDLIETVLLLAGMSAFVVVEISDPRSAALELYVVASNFAVPIVPIIKDQTEIFGMYPGLRKFHWVLPPLVYGSDDELCRSVVPAIIDPAREASARLTLGEGAGVRRVADYAAR